MPIGSKKPGRNPGKGANEDTSKGSRARGGNIQDGSPAGRAAKDEFGTRKVPAPSNKRKQGPTTKNYESRAESGRQWGQPGK